MNPPDFLDEVYHKIGGIVVTWGQLERGVDRAIDIILRDYPSEEKIKRPFAFSRRISLIRKFFSGHPGWSAVVGDTIDNVLNDAETVSDFRHALCHGFIEINENSNPKTISVKKRIPEDQTMLASYTVTLDELHEYGENLFQATLFICGLHEVLGGQFGKSEHSVENVLRKFLDERAGSLPC